MKFARHRTPESWFDMARSPQKRLLVVPNDFAPASTVTLQFGPAPPTASQNKPAFGLLAVTQCMSHFAKPDARFLILPEPLRKIHERNPMRRFANRTSPITTRVFCWSYDLRFAPDFPLAVFCPVISPVTLERRNQNGEARSFQRYFDEWPTLKKTFAAIAC